MCIFVRESGKAVSDLEEVVMLVRKIGDGFTLKCQLTVGTK